MLLSIRELPNYNDATIGRLAERLLVRHHSAVGLVDRLEAHGYVRRVRSTHDQRESGHALVSALAAILKHSNSRNRRKAANSQQRKGELKPKHRSTRAQTPNARQSESRCAQPGNMRGLCYLVH